MMTALVGRKIRRGRLALLVASLGVVLAPACDDGKPGKQAETPPSPAPPRAEEPAGLGLEDGQIWRLALEGEGVSSQHGGASVRAVRKEFDLSVTFEGEGEGLVLMLENVPMGQVGRFPATPARFHASTPGIDCGTAKGGAIRVNLTHNEVDRLAGRIEGKTECKTPEGAELSWSGVFDYSGSIEFR